jgi:DHA2 family multidrug resistance protein
MATQTADGDFAGGIGGLRRVLITISVMLATIMQAVDMTIANVALPNMQGSLATTQDQIAWVLTSYIVTSAIMMPPTGFLAGRFGRKRLFIIAVVGFTATSMLCGYADSLTEMVLYRILQGGFGAFLVPLSQAVLLDTYPPEQHGTAMAVWGMGVMIGPILGPTLGGYLTEYYDWRWVFFINLPIGILALIGFLTVLPETTKDRVRRFDWFGFALLGIAVASFQIMLDRGELMDWFDSTEIIIEAFLASLALYMFVAHMLTTKSKPFIDPHIFTDRNFVIGLVLIILFGALLLTGLALLPPYLQTLMDYPVVTVGLVLAPRGLGAMAGMVVVSQVNRIIDMRYLMVFGLGLIAWGMWEMTLYTADVSMFTLLWTGVVQGIGFGFFYVPLTVLAFTTLGSQYRTEAAGMFNLCRNVGSSVSISVLIGLVIRYTQINHAEIAGMVSLYSPMIGAGHFPDIWSLANPAGRAAVNAEVTRQAATIAYLNDFKAMTIVSLIAIPFPLLFTKPILGRSKR